MAPPNPADRISVPRKFHAWPLAHARVDLRTRRALERSGLALLGDLDGREWAYVWRVEGMGQRAVEHLALKLDPAALAALPPPPTAGSRATLPGDPESVLAWLMTTSKARQLTAALRHHGDRETCEAIGAEWDLSRGRVGVLAAIGRRKAVDRLATIESWARVVERSRHVVAQLGAVTDAGLYRLLAHHHGWETPPEAAAARALRVLLALGEEFEVIRRGEIAALCCRESEGWDRIASLARQPAPTMETALTAYPADIAALAVADWPRLVELGDLRRKPRRARAAKPQGAWPTAATSWEEALPGLRASAGVSLDPGLLGRLRLAELIDAGDAPRLFVADSEETRELLAVVVAEEADGNAVFLVLDLTADVFAGLRVGILAPPSELWTSGAWMVEGTLAGDVRSIRAPAAPTPNAAGKLRPGSPLLPWSPPRA